MSRRICCQRSVMTGRSSVLVAQAAEAGDMDPGVIALIVVVGVEPEAVEGLTARRAPIPILAPAAHQHDLPVELLARIETLPLPEPAVAALDQPHRHAARLP